MTRRKRDDDRPRNVFGSGYSLSDSGNWIREVSYINLDRSGDYGCEPIGEVDGELRWRMVPSGDVVGRDEMTARLRRADGAQ